MASRKKRERDQQEHDHQAGLRRKLAEAGIDHVRLAPGARLTDEDVRRLQAIMAKLIEEFGED